MSSHVHTSVWRSNLPSLRRSAHTDTPSGRPDGPGCQGMKGERKRASGRKKECERKEVQQDPRTQAHPGFSISNNHQPPGRSSTPRTPSWTTSFIYLNQMQCFWQLCFLCVLCKMPSTNVIAAFQICNSANT